MFIVESYGVAVALCFVTMLCWGSWANTQKLATQEWRFQLFYWDYSIGVLLLALLLAFTLGSSGEQGRSFVEDISQASPEAIKMALLGGAVFNLANILLVVAIDIAGMAVAFPVGIGLALVIGVLANYDPAQVSNSLLLFLGVGLVVVAIVLDALIYRRLPADGQSGVGKGLVISVIAGIAMGFFYRFVAQSMSFDFASPEPGLMTPYSAGVWFGIGLLVSNLLFLIPLNYKPVTGEPVPVGDYFRRGTPRLHLVGILGGAIWATGFCFNIIAAGKAGYAVSYGLGQGATMVAAFWGVFIWKEFRQAPAGTNSLIAAMFAAFLVGLGMIIYSNL
ncbi:multidrug DMT transporter permease [Seongchinamella sediminis]|uniref:Multidrug DMT transporter permease n=1 Tax=Seongchinamella sediminis TaxID=2283635 RepID=A0A3L7DWW1_9GAMM|nr:multidrug DMT transporter permease [Seongchinamella sediminis]RLQ21804.1 multidrug DMT transporter permease [Seongchinamella sediminis]